MNILSFSNTSHREQVISLWRAVFGYEANHNEPGLVIDKKLQLADDLFFVATDKGRVIGTIMAGYDGHRGWIYSLAVEVSYRHDGLGTALLAYAETKLKEAGCMKINLQILADNSEVEAFYRANGYSTEPRISMGKKLPENICNKDSAE